MRKIFWFVLLFLHTNWLFSVAIKLILLFWKEGIKFYSGLISCTALIKMPSCSMTVVSKCCSNK